MWCSKILVAYDGSTQCNKAVDLALSIAEADESVHVVFAYAELVSVMSGGVGDSIFDLSDQEVASNLQTLIDKLPGRAEAVALHGLSASALLLKHAKECGADLIIVGSRGKSGLTGYLGSVSYAVAQQASVPVLIAK